MVFVADWKERTLRVNRGRTSKIVLVLLLISVVLTVAIASIENSSPPKLTGTSVPVSPANVIWSKTYGDVGDDDRAYCMLPTDDGYFIVGSSQSNQTKVTVGWALMLNRDGDGAGTKPSSKEPTPN